MKQKQIKQLEDDLRADLRRVQPDAGAVWKKIAEGVGQTDAEHAPVPAVQPVPVQVAVGSRATNGSGKNLGLSLGAVAMVVLLCLTLLLVFFLPHGAIVPPVITYSEVGYMVLDINPSVQLKLDKNGRVTAAIPLNEDARVLLTGKEELVGMTDAEAAQAVLGYAQSLGYVSPLRKNNAVLVAAYLDDAQSGRLLQQKVSDALKASAKQKGIYCVVLTDVKTDASVKAEAEKYGVSESKMRLIREARAIDASLIADAEIPAISVAEIYARMLSAGEELEDSMPEDLQDEYERLEDEAEKLTEKLTDGIEQAMEELEELFDDDDTAEAAFDRMEQLLDLIEDVGEQGLKTDALFGELYAELETLAAQASEAVRAKIAQITADVKKQVDRFNELYQKAEEHFDAKRLKLAEKAQKETADYEKDDDFDDLFDDWYEANARLYADDWDALSAAWRAQLGGDYD